jgi:hypothetical protein
MINSSRHRSSPFHDRAYKVTFLLWSSAVILAIAFPALARSSCNGELVSASFALSNKRNSELLSVRRTLCFVSTSLDIVGRSVGPAAVNLQLVGLGKKDTRCENEHDVVLRDPWVSSRNTVRKPWADQAIAREATYRTRHKPLPDHDLLLLIHSVFSKSAADSAKACASKTPHSHNCFLPVS